MVARLLLALLGGVAVITHGAQAQTLVIQGGTLIDGTGRAPIENSVIVIEGNRFRAIGRAGEVSIPAGAQTIDVRGKTVLPGFIDPTPTDVPQAMTSPASSVMSCEIRLTNLIGSKIMSDNG